VSLGQCSSAFPVQALWIQETKLTLSKILPVTRMPNSKTPMPCSSKKPCGCLLFIFITCITISLLISVKYYNIEFQVIMFHSSDSETEAPLLRPPWFKILIPPSSFPSPLHFLSLVLNCLPFVFSVWC